MKGYRAVVLCLEKQDWHFAKIHSEHFQNLPEVPLAFRKVDWNYPRASLGYDDTAMDQWNLNTMQHLAIDEN